MINKRSLKKTISWRIIATIVTGSIFLIFTGEISKTTQLTIINAIALTILYYIHEIFWSKK
jgi:uncharacterized membrane protein